MFFESLKNVPIKDILQVGFVSIEEGIAEMTTMHRHLFINFGTGYLKLESVDQYSKLNMSFVSEISFDFSIEEDMFYSKNSISEIVLTDTMADNRINEIEAYGLDESTNLICDALCFKLVCGQELFFDPTFFFGINVGGQDQKRAWLNNYPNSNQHQVQRSVFVFE